MMHQSFCNTLHLPLALKLLPNTRWMVVVTTSPTSLCLHSTHSRDMVRRLSKRCRNVADVVCKCPGVQRAALWHGAVPHVLLHQQRASPKPLQAHKLTWASLRPPAPRQSTSECRPQRHPQPPAGEMHQTMWLVRQRGVGWISGEVAGGCSPPWRPPPSAASCDQVWLRSVETQSKLQAGRRTPLYHARTHQLQSDRL